MRPRILALLVIFSLLLLPALAQAQEPQPPMPPAFDTPPPPVQPIRIVPPSAVRLKLYRVGVEIKDQVATTHVEQTFVNDGPTPVEGAYLFPLPEGAAISDFNMIVDGQRFEGQIMRKEEARAIYENIVRQQRDPALLEYVGRDLFQARIFPIPPRGERKIDLTYSQVLPNENGLIHYRYPLRTFPFVGEGRGVRFVQPIDQLAIAATIQTTSPLKAIYSPTYPVVVSREGEYQASVGYEGTNVVPTADFDLYFSVEAGDVSVSLLSYKPAGEDGFFLLLAAPKVEVDPGQVVARDVLLVLDTSGSMQGQKIEQAKNALGYVLDHLNPQDRFNIVSFSTGIKQFEGGPQPASRVADAKRFGAGLEAAGGTDINRALLEALAQADASAERPTVIIFLTDGLPTEGVVDAQQIIDGVSQQAGPTVQVFAFGVGDDVNTVLLDSISQENRGASAYVRPNQAIDEVVSGFYAKVATPVLSNLAIDFGSATAEDSYPYPLPDLFAGSQLVLAGRYREGGPTAVTLRGLVNGQEKSYTFPDLTLHSEGGEPFIARLWATRKIGHLLNEIRLRGQNQELVDEIIRLSTRYGIATPYTSFFVPEPPREMPVDAQGVPQPMPTAAPAAAINEVEKQMEAAAAPQLSAAAAAPASGAAAVEESQAREALRSADTAAGGEATGGIRTALDKSFAYQGGRWVDTAYKADLPKQELEFGGEDYFKLLTEHPEWSAYFAVSPNLAVVLDGVVYVVTDTGAPMAAEPTAPAVETPSLAPTAPANATAEPAAVTGPTTPPAPVATVEAAAIAAVPSVAVAPAEPQPGGQTPFCTAPAFGIGLVLLPGAWAWRRRRK